VRTSNTLKKEPTADTTECRKEWRRERPFVPPEPADAKL